MKKSTKFRMSVIALLVVVICLVLFVWHPHQAIQTTKNNQVVAANENKTNILRTSEEPASSSSREAFTNMVQDEMARMKRLNRDSDREITMWQAPLVFYGKIVNESNQPIAGVQVAFNASAMDGFRKEIQNTGVVFTDERGIFVIDNVNGIGAMLELSHSNYYSYPDNINSFDKRGVTSGDSLPSNEYRARLFRMHSKGHPVALIHRVDGINVPLDGVPKSLDLRGSDYNQKIGQLVVEATGTPPPHYSQQPFDWDAKISVPNGGFVECTNQFDFVAPNIGYQPTIEYSFPKETPGWVDTVSKNYFVKLPSGYARLNIYIGAKRPLFFSIEYDYNPDGSANLERYR
jgi:hypothetical protein